MYENDMFFIKYLKQQSIFGAPSDVQITSPKRDMYYVNFTVVRDFVDKKKGDQPALPDTEAKGMCFVAYRTCAH